MGEPSLTHAAPAPAGADLDRRLVSGIAWTAVIRWLSQVMTWGATIIVARILSPEAFGLVGMAEVFLGLVTLFSEFGIGSSLVIYRDLRPEQVRQVNSLAVGVGVASMGLALLAAEPLGAFFGAREVPGIVVVMSFGFVAGSFQTVGIGLLEKELRFKLLAGIDATRAMVSALAMVLLAWLGFGYWALVVGALLNTLVSALLVVAWRRSGFSRPRREGVVPLLRLSSHIIVSRLCWFLYSKADFVVIGRVLGESALGLYSIGMTLASVPVDKIWALVSRVTPAVFASVQTEPAALRRYLLSVTEGLSLICFPVAWGLAVSAPELVPTALGEKWDGAIGPLQLLAAYAAVRCVSPLQTHVLTVTGHTHFTMRMGIVAAIVMPVVFVVGSHWGPTGVAAAWMVGHPLVLGPVYWQSFRVIELRPLVYARALWPATSAGATMAAAVFATSRAMPADWAPWLRLVVVVAVGAATYAGVLLVFFRGRLRAARDVVSLLRKGETA